VQGHALNRGKGWGPWRARLGQHGALHLGRTRVQTRIWLEVGDEPDTRGPPDSEREKGDERGRAGLGRLG
jgi:hypothetical protein